MILLISGSYVLYTVANDNTTEANSSIGDGPQNSTDAFSSSALDTVTPTIVSTPVGQTVTTVPRSPRPATSSSRPTSTSIPRHTETPTISPPNTVSPTVTLTMSPTATETPEPTPTPTRTPTPTQISKTPTSTPTRTQTPTPAPQDDELSTPEQYNTFISTYGNLLLQRATTEFQVMGVHVDTNGTLWFVQNGTVSKASPQIVAPSWRDIADIYASSWAAIERSDENYTRPERMRVVEFNNSIVEGNASTFVVENDDVRAWYNESIARAEYTSRWFRTTREANNRELRIARAIAGETNNATVGSRHSSSITDPEYPRINSVSKDSSVKGFQKTRIRVTG